VHSAPKESQLTAALRKMLFALTMAQRTEQCTDIVMKNRLKEATSKALGGALRESGAAE
jgi:hypothetical protein